MISTIPGHALSVGSRTGEQRLGCSVRGLLIGETHHIFAAFSRAYWREHPWVIDFLGSRRVYAQKPDWAGLINAISAIFIVQH